MPKRKKVDHSGLLDDPVFWPLLVARLSGTDPVHDERVLRSLHKDLGIKPQAVLARLAAYCHPAARGFLN